MAVVEAPPGGPWEDLPPRALRLFGSAAWFLALGCGLLFCGTILAGGSMDGSASFMTMVAFGEAAMLAFFPAWYLLGRAVRLTPRFLAASAMRPFRLAFLASAFGYAGGFAVAAWSILSSWGSFVMVIWTVPMVALLSYVPATYVAVIVPHVILFALVARGLPGRLPFFFLLGVSALGLGAAAGLAGQLLVPLDSSGIVPWIGLVAVGYAILAVACGQATLRLNGVLSQGPARPSQDPSP